MLKFWKHRPIELRGQVHAVLCAEVRYMLISALFVIWSSESCLCLVPPVKTAFYIQPRVPLPFCLRHSSLPLLENYYPRQATRCVLQSFLILPGTFTETFSLIYFFGLKKFLLQVIPGGFTNCSSDKPRNKLSQKLVTVSYKVMQLLRLEIDL